PHRRRRTQQPRTPAHQGITGGRMAPSPLNFVLSCAVLLPSAAAADLRFTTGRNSAAMPFVWSDDHIYLRVSVNQSRPLSFLVDTGASHNVIDLRVARELGLKLQSIGEVDGGIGATHPDAYLVTDSILFRLPGAVLADQAAVAISLDPTGN